MCDAVTAGTCHVLIRKGGIAEGRAGFELKKSFFGLLPTLFHQVKNANPDADAPTPPGTVSLICQLVEAFAVPSSTALETLAPFHAYSVEQLATRQQYKPERPLHLLIIRPFRLRQPIEIPTGTLKATCRSWVELPLEQPMGGIEPVTDVVTAEPKLDALRTQILQLPEAARISP